MCSYGLTENMHSNSITQANPITTYHNRSGIYCGLLPADQFEKAFFKVYKDMTSLNENQNKTWKLIQHWKGIAFF